MRKEGEGLSVSNNLQQWQRSIHKGWLDLGMAGLTYALLSAALWLPAGTFFSAVRSVAGLYGFAPLYYLVWRLRWRGAVWAASLFYVNGLAVVWWLSELSGAAPWLLSPLLRVFLNGVVFAMSAMAFRRCFAEKLNGGTHLGAALQGREPLGGATSPGLASKIDMVGRDRLCAVYRDAFTFGRRGGGTFFGCIVLVSSRLFGFGCGMAHAIHCSGGIGGRSLVGGTGVGRHFAGGVVWLTPGQSDRPLPANFVVRGVLVPEGRRQASC